MLEDVYGGCQKLVDNAVLSFRWVAVMLGVAEFTLFCSEVCLVCLILEPRLCCTLLMTVCMPFLLTI